MLGLRTTIYKVNDINKAKDWYSKAFNTKPYFDEPFYVGFSIGGFELGLQPDDVPKAKKVDNVVSYWAVDKIEEEFARLKILGAFAHENPRHVGGDIWVASVKDPFGNVLGIIYNPHFEIID
jgi:predicted enzyme related to lactoylglutathione lyase